MKTVKTFFRHRSKTYSTLFSKDFLNKEATYELNKITEMAIKPERNNFIYKTGNEKRIKCFQKFKTIRSFGIEI